MPYNAGKFSSHFHPTNMHTNHNTGFPSTILNKNFLTQLQIMQTDQTNYFKMTNIQLYQLFFKTTNWLLNLLQTHQQSKTHFALSAHIFFFSQTPTLLSTHLKQPCIEIGEWLAYCKSYKNIWFCLTKMDADMAWWFTVFDKGGTPSMKTYWVMKNSFKQTHYDNTEISLNTGAVHVCCNEKQRKESPDNQKACINNCNRKNQFFNMKINF
jgi:hypothetical protein